MEKNNNKKNNDSQEIQYGYNTLPKNPHKLSGIVIGIMVIYLLQKIYSLLVVLGM